jgi:hypothetical protein
MDKHNLIKLDHKITYNDPDLHEKFNIIDEKEKLDLSDIIYKYDLISIFGLDDFLEEQIIEKIDNLYKLMIENEEIDKLCSNIYETINAHGVFSKINESQCFEKFMILFSYDNLHLFYPCICEFLDKGIISNEKIIALKNNVSKI